MKSTAIALLAATLLLTTVSHSSATGLPVGKYLEDPEHKNEVILFYLSNVFAGINLANSRMKPPLFCMSGANPDEAFNLIDNRIKKMQAEKKLTENTTIDAIMMDILIDEYPCK